MNNFPPLFPTSKFLNKKSWHKYVYILSFIYSGASAYSFFLAFLVLLNTLRILNLSISVIYTAPMSIVLFPLMIFAKPTPHLGTNISYPFFQDPEWGLIILMGYFFISIFLPSLIYLLVLNTTFGKKWRS